MSSTDRAREEARAQLQSIVSMVAALNCDYYRLAELRRAAEVLPPGYVLCAARCGFILQNAAQGESSDCFYTQGEATRAAWAKEYPDDAEELSDLEEAAAGCADEEEACERIREDALDVQVRDGWHAPGVTNDAEEFFILLCTGGPAVRIMGEFDEHGEPSRARLEYQDWGTPWALYHTQGTEHDALLTYCRQFYFGQ